MDSQVVTFMSTVIPQVKNAQISIFLFSMGLVIPMIVAIFAIRWVWGAVWAVSIGKTNIMPSGSRTHYFMENPSTGDRAEVTKKEYQDRQLSVAGIEPYDFDQLDRLKKYKNPDDDAIALFGNEERVRIAKVKASYPAKISMLEAKEKKWGF